MQPFLTKVLGTLNQSCINPAQQNQSFVAPEGFLTHKRCIQEIKDRKQIYLPTIGKNPESFTFDFVGGEDVTQEEIFQTVGKPIVDQCLLGYNGSIFAYGQTGSGKTYTIQGASIQAESSENRTGSNIGAGDENSSMQIDNSNFNKLDKNQRGLLPRSFEYLFQQIQKIKNLHNIQSARGKASARKSLAPSSINLPKFHENCVEIEFDVKCSFLEIYNENIIDLLDSSDKKIQIREDKEHGVYAEYSTEEKVNCIQDVLSLIAKGTRNRKIASTNMNRESSRSHAVFTAIIKVTQTLSSDEQLIKTARFHVVDLAGSERCKETGAEGQRLKEASMINKSLTTLGSVINELADISSGNETKGKSRHIRYRESKLTYLLRDALGGNSKTVMICNVNPHLSALRETKSTLQFAQRAKMIKNSAVVNEENTSYKYWKEKYQREIGFQRANTLPNPSFDHNITFSLNQEMGNGMCQNCKKHQDGGFQSSSKFKDNNQEKLYLDSQKHIKELTHQLKEETDKRNIMEAQYAAANEETQKLRNQMKFQVKLKENQLKRLHEDLNSLIGQKIDKGSSFEEDFRILTEQMEMLKQENQVLKDQVDTNPLLAIKVAKIKELEIKIGEIQNFTDAQNGLGTSLSKTMNEVLEHIDQSIKYLEQNFSSSKKDANIAGLDIEMADVNPFNRSFNLAQSQMNDISYLTVKRDQEVANIKIQYEEQLDTLKRQLKGETSKNQKLIAFLTQKGSQNTQYNDELLTSTQSFNNMMYNTQGLLCSQRTAGFNQSQYLINQTQNQIIEADSENQINSQGNPIYEEMQMLLNDCQMKIQEYTAQIGVLTNELETQRQITDEISRKYEEAMNDKINLETFKLQLEDKIGILEQDLEQISQENQQIYQIKADLEQLQNLNEDLELKNNEYIEEISTLQQTNDYFANKALPDFEKQIQSLNEKFKNLMDENKSLKELKNKDQNIDELLRQIQSLKTQNSSQENQLKECMKQISVIEQVMVDQKNYIVDLNTKAKEDDEKMASLRDQLNKNDEQRNELEEILNEAQKQLQATDNKISDLEGKNQQMLTKCIQLDQQNKQLKDDKHNYEQKIVQFTSKLEVNEQEKNLLHKQLNESQRKYEAYKSMSQKQIQQIEQLVEELKAFRSNNSDSQATIDEKVRKIKTENRDLKDKLRQKEQVLQSLERRVQQWESQRDQFAQKDVELQRLRNYQKECESLRAQLEIITTANGQLESQLCIIESELKNQKQRYENLERENATILNIGDTQKYQHLNQVRGQSNQTIKQLNESVQELKKCKEKISKLELKIRDQNSYVLLFGNEICQRLQINRNTMIKTRPEDNFKQYINDLLEIITQTLTNQKLVLETPNNISYLKQSEEISSSSQAESSSHEDSRLNFFGIGNQEVNKQQDQHNQNIQPQNNQLQSRTIYLGAGQSNRYDNSANTSMNNEEQENQGPQHNNYQSNIQISDQPVLQLKKAFKLPTSINSSQFSTQNQIQPRNAAQVNSGNQSMHKNNFSASKPTKAAWGSNLGLVSTINRSQISGSNTQGANQNINVRGANGANRNNGQNNQSMREPSNQRMDIDS
ncbi:kinesin-like protein kif15 [Stylonychia lemnae]|uniref:Kinesin-like protein kif15 n=1 Tax=Stylonychia lemnae TaxID=5949 RepID=A0A078ADA4_STYLE|nr:kinesin-like protein kif15 [Stylonychia lemnae]|eukprot:CDW79512.1 kinesin-like protein kif15 [Stylonychia lemnae]